MGFIRKLLDYIFSFSRIRRGGADIMGALVSMAIVGMIAVNSSTINSMSLSTFVSADEIMAAHQYARDEAQLIRQVSFSKLDNIETDSSPVEGSNDYYKKIKILDHNASIASPSDSNSVMPGKKIGIEIYKGNPSSGGVKRAELKMHCFNPSAFDSEISTVTNDPSSDSMYKAMSADAFREFADSKIVNNKDYTALDAALSGKATKEYTESKMLAYAKKENHVWKPAGAVGSVHRPVYVTADGEVKPIDVVFRGKNVNNSDSLILIPYIVGGDFAYINYVKRSDLYNRYKGSIKYTFTIKQSEHQTITVTTSDGVSHTETFKVSAGTSWTATIKADTGYEAGTLSATSGTVKGNYTLSATEATKLDCAINIVH